ncbi:MAG: PASTA domain-containing protein [Acidimicrobiales bacterium]
MRARSLDEHVGRVLGRRYRLVAPIGSGGSARVYLAEDLSLHRRVAVKLLHAGLAADPRFARRFESEARSSAQLNHPHILAVYDWSDTDPAYLVSELLEGGSLRSMLDGPAPLATRSPGEANRTTLSLSQALMVGLQAAQGLAYAHERGFVHRDIKPANLLFDDAARLRIADFGIARAVAEANWTEPEGALVGTARYAAPEQATADVVDGRADVYGLALSLVEAVTGSVPLTAPTALSTMLLRQDTNLEVPSELGPLAPVLAAAGRAAPGERIDAATLARGLHRAASSLPRPKRLPLVPIDVTELAVHDAEGDGADPEATIDTAGTIVLGERPIDLRAEATGVLPATNDNAPVDVSTMATSVHRAVEPARGATHHTAEMVVEPGGDGRYDDDDDDDVIETEDVRRRWPFVVLLLVLIAGAAVAYKGRDLAPGDIGEVFATPTHPMGTFVGQDIASVRRDIELNNWLVEVDDTVRQDGSVPGEVLAQSPEPGVEYEEGLIVTLVVSAGLELRTVPTLVGLQQVDAAQALDDVKLVVGTVTEVDDEEIPVGQVVAASVEPETELETGSAVDLTVSRGPAPRTIPAIQGLDVAGAQQAIEAVQLVFVGGEESSRDVPEGEIISVTPAVGTTVERGSEVTVVFSTGKPFVTVPDVTGMSAADAADALQAAGFWVQDTEGPPNSEVLATNPPAGESHREGTAVVIFTR